MLDLGNEKAHSYFHVSRLKLYTEESTNPNPQTFGYSTPPAMQILRALKNISSIIANFPSQNWSLVSASWKFRQKEKDKESWWTNLGVHSRCKRSFIVRMWSNLCCQ